MKKYFLMLVGVMAFVPVTRAVDRIVTTTVATGAGSLTAAINALADGDTIKFAIPGRPHFIQTPPDGYPIITNNNVTIDGYSQSGASPNTASIHSANNAVLKIVLTSTNGNALAMKDACNNSWGSVISGLGWGNGEQAIIAFFHATNAVVQGLCIQSAPVTDTSVQFGGDSKSICFAASPIGMCQNFRVSGCWFGIDPVTKQVAYMPDGTTVATPTIAIAQYDTAGLFNFPGTCGVAAGSANPRAEFNVFVTGYGFDNSGLAYRVSGNFFNVLPDGVTAADMDVLAPGQVGDGYFECGGNNSDITIGTDGDGVNDADEGNIFGPWSGGGAYCIDNYSANGHMTNFVVAGNYFNVDINGNSFGANLGTIWNSIKNVATVRFGSDFNGVSDALEANKVSNYTLFKFDTGWPNNKAWVSMRGNSMVNSPSFPASTPPLGDGQTASEGYNVYTNFIDVSGAGASLDIIPVVGAGTTTTSLTGTCGKPLGAPYTRVIVDLYEADTTSGAPPQGKKWLASFQDNSAADSNPAVGAFTFSTTGLGLAPGTMVTIAVTYSKDTQPTIGSIVRAGNQTSLNVTGGAGPGPVTTYGINKSSVVNGTYTYTAAAVGGAATFTDNNNPSSFYVATGPSATGQTSPFSALFTMP